MLLTDEDIRNAYDYIPDSEKREIAEWCGAHCVDKVEIQTDDGEFAPPMYRDNKSRIARCLMFLLVNKYLRKNVEPAETYLMALDDYDRFAKAHVVNQIERFKANVELRDKCFDILYDFKDLEKRINAEIYSNIQIMNDPVTRASEAFRASITPESVKNVTKETEELMKLMEKYTQSKG